LNAQITGVIQREGYTIQKLVFESHPQFFVTAYVYKSDSAPAGRLPVIVNVNGHWAHKKGEDRVQLRCAFQALRGYLAIAIDSPGWSFEGNSLIERRAEGGHNDFALVEGGTNATGYYVWDVMRALDYLSTRNDADMTRVGITGASGGGLATLYAFAADDRFKAAVPVVYMSSMELAPDNGCLCNHVPGTMQIGDRSDVIAIQAPKPVYIMGAQNDPEFPPDAMRLTVEKMKREWSLFSKDGDLFGKIFDGPHDYNQPMREAMIGFFDKALRNLGDGSPVPQPRISAFDPEDRSFLVLPEPIKDERTMRELAVESLNSAREAADRKRAISFNGGRPQDSPLKYRERVFGTKRFIEFESQPGLVTPGVLLLPAGRVDKVEIVVSDEGKQNAVRKDARQPNCARLYLDIVGTGELSGIELRYPIYLGRSLAFIGGWQIVRAAEAMKRYSHRIELVGTGPLSSQAVMFAGLMDDGFSSILGLDCLGEWSDVFRPGIPPSAVQPRANLLGTLSDLRALVRNSRWETAQSSGTRPRRGS
jgi:dienelactone hydrolase